MKSKKVILDATYNEMNAGEIADYEDLINK